MKRKTGKLPGKDAPVKKTAVRPPRREAPVKEEPTAKRKAARDPLRPLWLKRALAAAWALAALVAVLACAVKIKTVMMRNDAFTETFYIIQSEKIDRAVRTVHLSDLHLKQYGKDNARLIERVKALKPDFISLTGDMLTYGAGKRETVYSLCRELAAVAPTYYAYGNHELNEILINGVDLKTELEATGVTVLSREFVRAEIGGNDFVIGGLSQEGAGIDEYAPGFMESFVAEDGFRLLLTHYPSNFDGWIEGYPIDLALCGHEHGGVVRLPVIGALYSKTQGLFPELTEGEWAIGNSTVIISRGLGDSGPVPRVNNAPELVVVDIIGSVIGFNYE